MEMVKQGWHSQLQLPQQGRLPSHELQKGSSVRNAARVGADAASCQVTPGWQVARQPVVGHIQVEQHREAVAAAQPHR